MTIALTSPVAQPAATVVDIVGVFLDLKGSHVTLTYDQLDSSGNKVAATSSVTMTHTAFVTALASTSGTLRVRMLEVLQAAVPAFAGVVS